MYISIQYNSNIDNLCTHSNNNGKKKIERTYGNEPWKYLRWLATSLSRAKNNHSFCHTICTCSAPHNTELIATTKLYVAEYTARNCLHKLYCKTHVLHIYRHTQRSEVKWVRLRLCIRIKWQTQQIVWYAINDKCRIKFRSEYKMHKKKKSRTDGTDLIIKPNNNIININVTVGTEQIHCTSHGTVRICFSATWDTLQANRSQQGDELQNALPVLWHCWLPRSIWLFVDCYCVPRNREIISQFHWDRFIAMLCNCNDLYSTLAISIIVQ